jgi:hypothetical protein
MMYDRIIVKRNFLIDPMTMEHLHIGVEAHLDELDNVDECYLKARNKIDGWGLKEKLTPIEDDVPVIQKKENPIKHKIEDCNTMEELAALKPGLPFDLMKPYMNKLKELTELIK